MAYFMRYDGDEFPIEVESMTCEGGAALRFSVVARVVDVKKSQTNIKSAKPKKRAALNKFYCAHPRISNAIGNGENDHWTNATLEEATEKAREILEKEDRECVAIVKVVRLVRRQKPPIKIVEVK